jgi:putative transferase (TIGR04331 family)
MLKSTKNKTAWVASEISQKKLISSYSTIKTIRPFISPHDNLHELLEKQPDQNMKPETGELKYLRKVEIAVASALSTIFSKELSLPKSLFNDLFLLEIRRTVAYVHSTLNDQNANTTMTPIAYFDRIDNANINTFDDFRHIFNYTSAGQEILTNIFVTEAQLKNSIHLGQLDVARNIEIRSVVKRKLKHNIISNYFRKFLKIISTCRRPNIVAIGTYWSVKSLIILYLKTKFRLRHVNNIKLHNDTSRPKNYHIRKKIKEHKSDGDCIYFNMSMALISKYWPLEAIENISAKILEAKEIINQDFKNVPYWCFENWISNFDSAVLRSVISLVPQTTVINFEHNYTAELFMGNSNDLILPSNHINISLGANLRRNSLIGGSLFDFGASTSETRLRKNRGNYLLVLGVATRMAPEYGGAYGDAGRTNSVKSLIETIELLHSIPAHMRARTTIKAYPSVISRNFGGYTPTEFSNGIEQKYKKFIDGNIPAKKLMPKNELIIINYVSTTHLESMHRNIPTLLYWARDRFIIEDGKFENLQPLLDTNIIHFSVQSLVAHLEEIENDILAWWYSPAVQIARLNFLKLNCNKDRTIEEFLASIARNAS